MKNWATGPQESPETSRLHGWAIRFIVSGADSAVGTSDKVRLDLQVA